MPRPVILTFVAYYLPGYRSGGPVRTISNMVEHLGNDFVFRIVTADRDSLSDMPYPGVVRNGWNRVGESQVFYAERSAMTLRGVSRIIADTPHDLLYLNSFFNVRYTTYPMISRRVGMVPEKPLVIAPRGEFSEGALQLRKPKKKLFIKAGGLHRLWGEATWHASGEDEAKDIRRALGPVKSIHVAPNLAPKDALNHDELVPPCPQRSGALIRVVFLSRITPKKNLDYVLRVLVKVSSRVEFNVYGAISDDSYWRYCRRLIESLPPNVSVCYRGGAPHSEVHAILASHDLFFLPTKGENYGHVIREALSAGVPVLISDRTPWKGLARRGVGWDLSLDNPEQFAAIIDEQARLDCEAVLLQRKRAREYGVSVVQDADAVRLNRELFERLL